jgi:hypothetical protein
LDDDRLKLEGGGDVSSVDDVVGSDDLLHHGIAAMVAKRRAWIRAPKPQS